MPGEEEPAPERPHAVGHEGTVEVVDLVEDGAGRKPLQLQGAASPFGRPGHDRCLLGTPDRGEEAGEGKTSFLAGDRRPRLDDLGIDQDDLPAGESDSLGIDHGDPEWDPDLGCCKAGSVVVSACPPQPGDEGLQRGARAEDGVRRAGEHRIGKEDDPVASLTAHSPPRSFRITASTVSRARFS